MEASTSDTEVSGLLREWGLAKYIDVFETHEVTTLSMALLQPPEIKELIPEIGPRTLFTNNLQTWTNLMHPRRVSTPTSDVQPLQHDLSFRFSDIFDPTVAGSSASNQMEESSNIEIQPIQIHIPERDATPKNLQQLLESSLEGKGLLALNKEEPLTNIQRLTLLRIIANHILQIEPAKHIKGPTYALWTQEILQVFPRESASGSGASVYFHNKYVMSTKGVVARLSGKLPDAVANLKRKYRSTGVIPKRRRTLSCHSSPSTGPESPSLQPEAIIPDEIEITSEDLLWLKKSTDPWDTVEEKWRASRHARQQMLQGMSIQQYFQEIPALQKPDGYKLMVEDFENLHEEATSGLTNTFPLVKEKLFDVAARRSSKDKFTQSLIDLSGAEENTSNLAAILLIPSLMSVSTVAVKKGPKKTWRPSKVEVREGFVNHVTSEAALMREIDARRTKFANFGLTIQPSVFVVGPTIANIKSSFVVINTTLYLLPNVLAAVDVCFKIIWALQAQYPMECYSTWMFIQKGFYKLSKPHEKESTSANTLLSDLDM